MNEYQTQIVVEAKKVATDIIINKVDPLFVFHNIDHTQQVANAAKEIEGYYQGRMTILDSSEIIATALKNYLEREEIVNHSQRPKDLFLVSDYTESFEASARTFFHEAVHLEKHPLWNS